MPRSLCLRPWLASLLGLGWRSIFMINIPVGVIAVAASLILVRESRAPRPPRLDPVGVLLLSGGDLFKRELHMHHTAEDEIIWPVLRPRLAHSENALSVLDAMEEEHERIDPLLAAVDAALLGGSGGWVPPGAGGSGGSSPRASTAMTGWLTSSTSWPAR